MRKASLTKHTYDIDMIETIQRLEKELDSTIIKNDGPNKEEFILEIINSLKLYCEHNRIDFKYHYDNKVMLVIPSNLPYYVYALGITLMVYDPEKVHPFLDYQFRAYEGYDKISNVLFVDLIEQTAYHIVKNNSPFENSDRLDKITDWVVAQKNWNHKNLTVQKNQLS